MKNPFLAFMAAAALIALIVIMIFVGSFNTMASVNQSVDARWSDVQSSYQRRYDLIPNLVEVVKGAAAFEQQTLVAVTQARASVGQIKMERSPLNPQEMANFAGAQQSLGTALSRLLVVAESYPSLKATDQFRDLQAQIEGTENRIGVARHNYNEAVRAFNTSLVTFPGNFIAGFGRFQTRPYYTAESTSANQAPKVNFSK